MSSLFHQLDDPAELLKISSLRSSQWVLFEERNDLRPEVFKPVDVVSQQIFAVIVASTIQIDLPASEEFD